MATYTSDLARELAPGLLERFQRYVRIDTQSSYAREASPSTPGQLDLSRLLVSELEAAGCADVVLDDAGYVYATVPGGAPDSPVIGLIAHVDTSPDASGTDVEPIVHRGYDGGAIELPRDGTRLDPADSPELSAKQGHDIVTASGDTLLGADDKAGVAEIMTAVAHLTAHPELPRPTLRIAFTPDEEIGHGATLFDLDGFGASCAYTLDGSTLGEIQDETFSALELTATIRGVAVHPGFAHGRLVNALRLAGQVLAALPAELTPEATTGRDGFIHCHRVAGNAAEAEIVAIVRDFDEDKLSQHAELFRRVVDEVVGAEPRASYEVTEQRQYRNMRHYIEPVPQIMTAAEQAIRDEGLEPRRSSIRGGTDGSRLSEMGLPTPNLFTGGHDFHGPREWASLQDMAAAAATIVRLAAVWGTTGEVVSPA